MRAGVVTSSPRVSRHVPGSRPPRWMRTSLRPVCFRSGRVNWWRSAGRSAQAVDRGGRAVRDDALRWCPFPGRRFRGQLQPGGAQLEVFRFGGSGHQVDAVGNAPKQDAFGDLAGKGRGGDAGELRLAPRDQAKLRFGDGGDSGDGGAASNTGKCITGDMKRSMYGARVHREPGMSKYATLPLENGLAHAILCADCCLGDASAWWRPLRRAGDAKYGARSGPLLTNGP